MIRQINILGIPYEIEEVDTVNKFCPSYGEIDFLACKISIDKNMPEPMKEQTLMHEILHATLTNLGYSELSENETLVQGLAAALYSIFKSRRIFRSDCKEFTNNK